MKRKLLLLLIMLLAISPITVFAQSIEDDEEGYEIVSEEHKYYKTITTVNTEEVYNISNLLNGMQNGVTSTTYEITKEEYDAATIDDVLSRGNPTIVETTYQHMTSLIEANGSYYRYKNTMNWKFMPTVRSHDIIAIGFLSSVELQNYPTFKQEYCKTTGECFTTYTSTIQSFSNGAGASFQLPSGDLISLKETFYFNVKKKYNQTITTQHAYADYAHAHTTVSLLNSCNYQVIQGSGIVLDSSISSYYDSMTVADATWTGSW